MSSVAELKTLLSAQTYSTESQLTGTYLQYLNLSYQKIVNTITEEIPDKYFYEYFKTNTVADQSEYTLPLATSTTAWVKRVISVEIMWGTTDSDYQLLYNANNTEYNVSLLKLWTDLPKSEWIYDVKDWSIFIYPTPLQSVTSWLKLQALVSIPDLTDNDLEWDLFWWHTELRDWHYIIMLWAKPYVFQEKQLYNDKINADNEFNIELAKMIKTLSTKAWPVVWKTPDLTYYKY
jgi:hypothetical protein